MQAADACGEHTMNAITKDPDAETEHEHAYARKKGRGNNEYAVVAAPMSLLPDDLPSGYRRISRQEALEGARWTWDDGPAYVTVVPCACGACALSEYAEDHPGSPLRDRIQKAEMGLSDGTPDILGRQQHNPYTGEYDGELPRYGAHLED